MFLPPSSHTLHSHFQWIPSISVCTNLKIQVVLFGCSKLSHNHTIFLSLRACYDLRLEAKSGSGVSLQKNQHSLIRKLPQGGHCSFLQQGRGTLLRRECRGYSYWGQGGCFFLGVEVVSNGKESSKFQGFMLPGLSGCSHFNFQDLILS